MVSLDLDYQILPNKNLKKDHTPQLTLIFPSNYHYIGNQGVLYYREKLIYVMRKIWSLTLAFGEDRASIFVHSWSEFPKNCWPCMRRLLIKVFTQSYCFTLFLCIFIHCLAFFQSENPSENWDQSVPDSPNKIHGKQYTFPVDGEFMSHSLLICSPFTYFR